METTSVYSGAERIVAALDSHEPETASYAGRRRTADFLLTELISGLGTGDRIGLPDGSELILVRAPRA